MRQLSAAAVDYLAAGKPVGLEARLWVVCSCVQSFRARHEVPVQDSGDTEGPIATSCCEQADKHS